MRSEWGAFCYIRDLETGRFWSSGFQPSGREADSYEVTFAPDRAVIRRRDEGIETFTEVTVSPEDDAEIRRVSVTNHSREIRELELTSYAEVSSRHSRRLAPLPSANLLPRVDALPGNDGVICTGGRAARTPALYGALAGGRGRMARAGSRRPRAFHGTRGLCGGHRRSSGPLRCPRDGCLLDPIVRLRSGSACRRRHARVSYTTTGRHEDAIRALIEKYHDPQVCARAFALASTHARSSCDLGREPLRRSAVHVCGPRHVGIRPRSPEDILRTRHTSDSGSSASPATANRARHGVRLRRGGARADSVRRRITAARGFKSISLS